MTFKSLKIERVSWGENKGKLISVLEIEGAKAETTMELPEEVAEKILQISKQALVDGVEKAANDFIFEITTHIPDTLKIDTSG